MVKYKKQKKKELTKRNTAKEFGSLDRTKEILNKQMRKSINNDTGRKGKHVRKSTLNEHSVIKSKRLVV